MSNGKGMHLFEGNLSYEFQRLWTPGIPHNVLETEDKVPEWIEVRKENGTGSFFHNTKTKQSTWSMPSGDVLLLNGTVHKHAINSKEGRTDKQCLSRLFLRAKGAEASTLIQKFVRGYLTRQQVHRTYGYARRKGLGIFDDHPVWQSDAVVRQELRQLGIGIDETHLQSENSFQASLYESCMPRMEKTKRTRVRKRPFHYSGQPKPILGYQFGHCSNMTEKKKSPKKMASNLHEVQCSQNGGLNYAANVDLFGPPNLPTIAPDAFPNSSETTWESYNKLENKDLFSINMKSYAGPEIANDELLAHKARRFKYEADNLTFSPVRRRKLSKWCRGEEQSMKYQYPRKPKRKQNFNCSRNHVELNFRTESASSSESYLSRYLASRNRMSNNIL